MTVLGAQVDTFSRSTLPGSGANDLAESIDVGLKLYDALRSSVTRAEQRGMGEDEARGFHEMASELARKFGELLQRTRGSAAEAVTLDRTDLARLEAAWHELLPAHQFSFDRLTRAAAVGSTQPTKSAAEIRDGLRGQVHGRG
jgi:hypothetical protein